MSDDVKKMTPAVPLETLADAMTFFGRLFAGSVFPQPPSVLSEYLDRVRSAPPEPSRYWLAAEAINASTYADRFASVVYRDQPDQLKTVREGLKETRMKAFGRGMIRQRAEKAIFQTLSESAIPAIPYKGRSLELWLDMPEFLRPTGDIDLIIKKDDLTKAASALETLGFESEHPIQNFPPEVHDFHLRSTTFGLLELHIGTYQDLSPTMESSIWENATGIAHFDSPALRPDPTDLFILLAHHYILHGWTSSFKWTADIVAFCAALSGGRRPPYLESFTAERLIAAARKHSAAYQVIIALKLAQTIAGLPDIDALEPLNVELTDRQKTLLRRFDDNDRWQTITADEMIFALRSAPGAKVGWKETIWPSPEYVAWAMNCPVGSPFLGFARLRWLSKRLYRAVKMLLGTGRSDYRKGALSPLDAVSRRTKNR